MKIFSVQLTPTYDWVLIATITAAFVCLFVNLQTGVFTLLWAALAWWAWENPEAGLLWLLVISPVLSMFKVTQTLDLFTLSKDVLIVTLFLRLFAIPLLKKQLPYRRLIIFAPLAALFIWLGISALRADQHVLGILRARDLGLYPLLYLAVVYLPWSNRLIKEILGWSIATYIATTLLAIYQWFYAIDSTVLRFDPGTSKWIPRISSSFGHPSVYGQYLILIMLILLAVRLVVTNKRAQIASVLLLIPIPFLIYLTYSRGVWIAFVASLITVAGTYSWNTWSKWGKRFFTIRNILTTIVLCAIVLTAVVRFTNVGVFLHSTFDSRYESNRLRLDFIARLIAPMSNVEAMIGRGLGDVTQQVFRDTTVSAQDITSGTSRNIQLAKDSTLVDNQYLKTFVEMGLAGLLIYAWLFGRLFKAAWNLAKQTSAPQKAIGLLMLGFLVSVVIQAFAVDIWDIFPTNLAFWCLAGLTAAASTPHILDNFPDNYRLK